MLDSLKQHLKNYFLAGLMVVIPLATTIWLMIQIATWSVQILTSIPKQFNPFQGLDPLLLDLIDLSVGIAIPLLLILVIGFMARNIVGQWMLNLGEQLLHAIPIAGSIYKTLKQLLTTLLSDNSSKFRRVVLIQYPRPGIWTLAFVTGSFQASLGSDSSQRLMSVFIPTTPNPTTGWYAVVPEADTMEVFIPVEDAFKLVISGGIVTPDSFVASLQKRSTPTYPMPNLSELVQEERQPSPESMTESFSPETGESFSL